MLSRVSNIIKRSSLRHLGPGLITGAADDDPSGIATYSQAGAQFGFNLLWTVVLTFPLMVGIQMISARIGRVTGYGLAAIMRRTLPRRLCYSIVGLLVLANTINIAADIAAMGEALQLLLGGGEHWHALLFGVVSLLLQVFLPYRRYVRVLKWLTISLFSYVAVVFTVHVPWNLVLSQTLMPDIKFNAAFITVVVAVLGTTISPYLFFWQASQEVEDMRLDPAAKPLLRATADEARSQLWRIKVDTFMGMGFSNAVAFFIILSTAVTLNSAGITSIQTSAQAAEALRPLAGELTFLLFGLGIIGTGLLAVPVLAGSAAYAVANTLAWRHGLDRKLIHAKRFYAIIALATLGGVALDFTPIDPIQALFWSAVINAVISVPIMVIIMLMASREHVMGAYVLSRRLRVLGWIATAIMLAAVVAMFYFWA
ncbi:MAG: Nramp family divalent metal transporter [Gammaproteobacteria bacterium]|nr:Nramp family divalent metal transporter [Gammaproteobacteria bacterium]